MFTVHGEVREVVAGYLFPLSKPDKAKTAESSRPLAFLSAFRKILTNIVLARIEAAVSDFLSHYQHGARK